MSNPSRAKGRSQPAFDPSELDDLILTPAVGSGVSSHLLEPYPTPAPPEVDSRTGNTDLTTVDRLETAHLETPLEGHLTTVDRSVEMPPRDAPLSDPSTVVISNLTTVDRSLRTTVKKPPSPATADQDLTTAVRSHVSTVVRSVASEPAPARTPGRPLWITESGDPVPARKVRSVAAARDALSASEAALYDVLRSGMKAGARASAGTVQAGYDFLARHTGFSRKTVQRTIDKLLDKGFIEIETPAGIYTRTATVYRIRDEEDVLRRLTVRQRLHVARIGPGVVFVQGCLAREQT